MKEQIFMFCWGCHERKYVEKGRWNKENPCQILTSGNITNSSTSQICMKDLSHCKRYVLLSSYYITPDTGY